MICLYIILAVIAAALAVMLIRTVRIKSDAVKPDENYKGEQIDIESALKKLQGAIRIPTVTVNYDDEQSKEPFFQLHKYLEKSFPLFHEHAQKTVINECALIYKIEGTDDSLLPACFLGHMDVVPPQDEGWQRNPFSGEIDDEFIYGRGSFDMKGQLISLLESFEIMYQRGFAPRRTVYCCFGCDEEVSGNSAKAMCAYLKEKGVKTEFIFDEGMTLLDASIVGIKTLALVGVCEKGYANIKVTAKGKAGHASMPPAENAATILARAVTRINKHQMKAYWSEPLKCLIEKVAPHTKFFFKFIMANSAVFRPLLKPILCKVDPSTNALLRTTMAVTMLEGSKAANVIPDESSCVINCRTNIGQTAEDVVKHISAAAGKGCKVELLPTGHHEPTKMSPLDSYAWGMFEKTVAETFPGAVTAPFPFVAGTDSKYYSDLSESIFKFSPHITDAADRAVMHNVNERFRIKAFEGDIRFYLRFLQNTVY